MFPYHWRSHIREVTSSERTLSYPDLASYVQATEQHLPPELSSAHQKFARVVGWQHLCFHTKCQSFFPIRMNIATNILTDFISSLKVIQKAVCELGTFSLRGKMKTLGFLRKLELTPENPKISFHRLIRCHLPTHQLSCNQCISLPTWRSLMFGTISSRYSHPFLFMTLKIYLPMNRFSLYRRCLLLVLFT